MWAILAAAGLLSAGCWLNPVGVAESHLCGTAERMGVTCDGGAANNMRIDLRFVNADHMTSQQRALFYRAARRWERSIRPLTPHTVDFDSYRDIPTTPDWQEWWYGYMAPLHGQNEIVVEAEAATGPVILVGYLDPEGPDSMIGDTQVSAIAMPWWTEGWKDRPVIGTIAVSPAALTDEQEPYLESLLVHEIGHVLGVGSLWDGFIAYGRTAEGLQAINGYWATKMWKEAGGRGNPPVSQDGWHWHEESFGTEVMTSLSHGGREPLSAVTLGILLDMLVFDVDLTAADRYVVPTLAAGKRVPASQYCKAIMRPPRR